MRQKYTFKKATANDFKPFYVFFKQSIHSQFPQYSIKTQEYFFKKEYDPVSLSARLKNHNIVIYLACANQKVVGYLVVGVYVGGVCLIIWIAVDSKHQGQGIASKLLELCETDLKKKGVHKLHLWTDQKNVNFYKNRGYKLLGKIAENYYGSDDYFFYKSLQKSKESNFLKYPKL
ncbi:MAG: GNAT family N-acetyltransferase [Patescibacteria group bacterium]|nr:GNAT family N-acetyltransferase [Patescibacteria group bacterium]